VVPFKCGTRILLAGGSRAGRPCHSVKLHHYQELAFLDANFCQRID